MNIVALLLIILSNLAFYHIGCHVGNNEAEKKYCKLLIDSIEKDLKKIREERNNDKD